MVGLQEVLSRRVQFYDLTSDQMTNRILMMVLVIVMLLLIVYRYFRTLAMLEGTHQIPEKGVGSGLFGSGLIWMLLVELIVISLHSGPFVPFKTILFKSSITYGDIYGNP
jgi:hypothetical protein